MATRAYVVALLVQVALFVVLVPRLGPTGMALAAFGSTVAVTFVQTWLLSRRTGWGLRGFACILGGGVAGMLAIVATHR
ncbi:MAG: polysaccharide biosynthesis C-terminal domain-containing protein [Isosphaeraceae bacterium]